MAKYTYSFSCTIKYRFDTEQDNPEKPIFDNSSFLYTCQSDVAPNTKLAEMTGIKIVLPEYLQGTEEGVIWYSSRTDGYKDEYKITGNKELDISLWTPNNEKTSQVGTFISYELSIYLYSNTGEKTIDWTYLDDNGKYQTLTTFSRQQILTTPEKDAQEPDKEAYKNFYNSFILVNAPKIPTAVSVQETDTLTLYTFNTWTVTREKDNYNNYTNTYNIEAQYEETSFPASLPYTKKSKDPFADAEPYHYGVGTPPDGYFMPIGDDEDSTTDEIKVQAAEKNGYSTIKKLDDFKIKGKSIQYIEKGTFPLPQLLVGVEGEGGSFQDHKEGDIVDTSYGDVYGDDTADEACNHHHFCRLDISYDSNNTVKSIIFHKYQTDSMWEAEKTIARLCLSDSQNHDSYCIGHLEIQSSVGNFTNHGHPGEFPKTLGFILTGGGGGAGGISRLDPQKDGKENDYSTPGGGGGGGETICGVFDLTKPATCSDPTNNRNIYIVYLGSGGKGGAHWTGNASHKDPKWGEDGKDGKDSVIYWVKDLTSDKPLVELYRASGGFPGKRGPQEGCGDGGEGGSHYGKYTLYKSQHNCILCKQFKGGKGGHLVSGSTTDAVNDALELFIYFAVNAPTNDSINNDKFYIYRNYPATQSTHDTKDMDQNANVAGGHSFGQGATATRNPARGGGGCCNKSGGCDGAGGYFGLYY